MQRVRRQQRSFKKRWFTAKAKRGAVSSLLLTASTTPFLPSLGLWTPSCASHGSVAGFEDATKTDGAVWSSKICALGQGHGCGVSVRRGRRNQQCEESTRRSGSPECGPTRRQLRRCRRSIFRAIWKEGDEPAPPPVRPPSPPSPPRDDVEAYVAWNHNRRTRELRKVQDFLIRRFSPHLLRPNEPVDEYLCSTLKSPPLLPVETPKPKEPRPKPQKSASQKEATEQSHSKRHRRRRTAASRKDVPTAGSQVVPTTEKKPVSRPHPLDALFRRVSRNARENAQLVRSCSVFPVPRGFILDGQKRVCFIRRRRRVTRSLPSTARPPLHTLVEDPLPSSAPTDPSTTKSAPSPASTPSTAATRSPATTPRINNMVDDVTVSAPSKNAKIPTSTSSSASTPSAPLVLKSVLKNIKATDTSTVDAEDTLPPQTPKRVSFTPESIILKQMGRQNKKKYYAATRALKRQTCGSLNGLPERNHHSF